MCCGGVAASYTAPRVKVRVMVRRKGCEYMRVCVPVCVCLSVLPGSRGWCCVLAVCARVMHSVVCGPDEAAIQHHHRRHHDEATGATQRTPPPVHTIASSSEPPPHHHSAQAVIPLTFPPCRAASAEAAATRTSAQRSSTPMPTWAPECSSRGLPPTLHPKQRSRRGWPLL